MEKIMYRSKYMAFLSGLFFLLLAFSTSVVNALPEVAYLACPSYQSLVCADKDDVTCEIYSGKLEDSGLDITGSGKMVSDPSTVTMKIWIDPNFEKVYCYYNQGSEEIANLTTNEPLTGITSCQYLYDNRPLASGKLNDGKACENCILNCYRGN